MDPAEKVDPATRDVLLEFSMTPLDKGESVSAFVSRSLEIIDRSGLPYRLNPMGTVVEGTWEEALAVVTRCFERMRTDCGRISVSIKIDYRCGRSGRLEGKIASLERRLGRKLRTD
ncbi:MAG: MTH1187 family thiamine-binding protein [Candidatus Eisenbacteria bacterium]|uniref:MTH1187 family thiamine-binding protein n=1 Tax=Eiseniibacteriota bacterium TaxID=2212470 RepID=A0A937XB88_UNCEI|nr:MTH1187 family thiamine-binding protein [Candidatus Eisenbacteria bacterium]